MKEPKVAIVIVTWNKVDDVMSLLDSLHNIDYGNFETVVVDNASNDGTSEQIKIRFPNIKLLTNDSNLGGTGGFNRGIDYVMKNIDCKYIWLLDNDVSILENTLLENIKVLEKNEEIGIIGSAIINKDFKNNVVECGARINWTNGWFKPNCRNTNIKKLENNLYVSDYVAICSAVARKDVIETVGLMDERYFLIWDDMDLCTKIKKSGYKVYANPKSVVYHKAYTEKDSMVPDLYYLRRNCLLYFSKYSNFLNLALFNNLNRMTNYYFFLKLNNKELEAQILSDGLKDYFTNTWGHKDYYNFFNNGYSTAKPLKEFEFAENEKVLILNQGSIYSIQKTIDELNKHKNLKIHILTEKQREDLLLNLNYPVITMNRSVSSYIYNFIKISLMGFDIAIQPHKDRISMHSYTCRDTIGFIDDKFFNLNLGRKKIWKIIAAYLLGTMTSVVFSPFIYLQSLRYKEHG